MTHFYLIHNKPDGTKELIGLFKDQQEAIDVRVDWNEQLGIPIHEMTIIERIPGSEPTINPIDNQE